jgi:hypothetical protein
MSARFQQGEGGKGEGNLKGGDLYLPVGEVRVGKGKLKARRT